MFNCTMPCIAWIFQLQGYGQYGMHGSIVNVPTNLSIMQNILPRMWYDDYLAFIYFKRKLEYKLIYMSSYICSNIVMKTLQECYQIPLYIDANVSIKPNWQRLVEFTNASEE